MFDRELYFGNWKESRADKMMEYQAMLESILKNRHDCAFPLFDGDYSLDIYSFLKDKVLNDDPMSPEATVSYMSQYFENLPDWLNPGTLINVIPCVNLLGQAVSNIAQMYSPNCAQDTYSGNILLAELETTKYISNLIGWDWLESVGIFTFGGTGTNMYSLKMSILNAAPNSSKVGLENGKYFTVTSQNGHPCHYQLCDWVGLGTDSCIELPCRQNGAIDLDAAYEIIKNNIKAGKVFLGFNLTGGSTNEMYIDPVKDVYELRSKLIEELELSYSPWIHVDSVLGWVFLFFKDYDFDKNSLNIDSGTLHVLKSLANKVSQFVYADSVGVDFHKTGFCSYVTSLFIVKQKENYFKLNPAKSYDIKTMRYGEYNPFYVSLEYSRSCNGPIEALTCLKSFGKQAFRILVSDLISSTRYFREKLKSISNILIIEPDAEGYATIFSLLPKGRAISSVEQLINARQDVINEVLNLNLSFGKKILYDCVNHNKHFIFTSSRSYTIPCTNIKIGALKVYPMSVFFDRKNVDMLICEIQSSIDEFFDNAGGSGKYEGYDLFQDMSKEEK